MKIKVYIFFLFYSLQTYSQSDLENVLKGGEILVNGLSFLKSEKSEKKSVSSKTIESVCIKNKLSNKIIFKIVGSNEDGDEINKELVIQKEGKECVFELPKGIYTYEIILSNKEVYKKGEYKFYEAIVITVKDD